MDEKKQGPRDLWVICDYLSMEGPSTGDCGWLEGGKEPEGGVTVRKDCGIMLHWRGTATAVGCCNVESIQKHAGVGCGWFLAEKDTTMEASFTRRKRHVGQPCSCDCARQLTGRLFDVLIK